MMRLLSAALFSTLVVAAAQAPSLPGLNSQVSETSPPPALTAIRARLGETLIVADRAVTSQWQTTMAELEKTRADDRDYEGALRVRQRREQAMATAGSDDGRIPVPLLVTANPTKGPGVSVNEGQAMADFRKSGAFLEWNITGDFRGWYEVLLTHSVLGSKDQTAGITPITGQVPSGWRKQREADYYAPTVGGWASFQNMSSLSGSSLVLLREIVSTGGWNPYRTVSMGWIQIQPSRLATFRLTAEEAAAEGLMHFRQIELVPVSAPSRTGTGAEVRLTRGREWFDKEFRKGVTGSSNAYRTKLAALEQQAIKAKDNDLLVRVRDEVKRLNLSPDLLALSTDEVIAAAPVAIELLVNNSFNCKFRGETAIDSSRSFLTKLRPVNTPCVTWQLPAFNVGSGVYEVAIKCRVPLKGGGSATLAASGASGVVAGKPLKFDVKPVVPAAEGLAPVAEKRTEVPGQIVIGKNAETLTLSINSLTHADGWLLDLTSVTLTRTGDVPPEKKLP